MNAFDRYDNGEISLALRQLREQSGDPAARALVDLTENRPADVPQTAVESNDARYWELRSIAAWRTGDVAELRRAVRRASQLAETSDTADVDDLAALLAVAESAKSDKMRRAEAKAPLASAFDPSLSHVVVEIEINGETARMIVDTGAEMSLLDQGFADRIGVRFPSRSTLSAGTNTGHVDMSVGMVNHMAFLGIEWSDVPALVVGLSHLRDEFGVDGVLGVQDVLSGFVLSIDYPQGRIERHAETNLDGWPIYFTQGRALISAEGRMEGGPTGLFRIDTGGARSVLTKQYLSCSVTQGATWNVSEEQSDVRKVVTEQIRRRRHVARLTFLPAGLAGAVSLHDVPVDTTAADELIAYAGKLGADALKGRVLELDYPSCRLRLAPLD